MLRPLLRNPNNPVYGGKYTAWAAGNAGLYAYREGEPKESNPYPIGSLARKMFNQVYEAVEIEVLIYGSEIY